MAEEKHKADEEAAARIAEGERLKLEARLASEEEERLLLAELEAEF